MDVAPAAASAHVATRLPIDGDASSPVFLDGGAWAYQRLNGDTSDLVHRDGQVLLADVRRVQRSADGAFWFCRPGRAGLWRQPPGEAAEQITDALAAGDWKNWLAEADGAWLVVRDLVHHAVDAAAALITETLCRYFGFLVHQLRRFPIDLCTADKCISKIQQGPRQAGNTVPRGHQSKLAFLPGTPAC